jgi:hypothetical protein
MYNQRARSSLSNPNIKLQAYVERGKTVCHRLGRSATGLLDQGKTQALRVSKSFLSHWL